MPHITPYLLTNNDMYQVLASYLRQLCTLKPISNTEIDKQIYQQAYISWYNRNTTQPDHVFNNYWMQLESCYRQKKSWALTLFKPLSEFYFDRGDKLTIQTTKFDEWQSFIADNNAIPIIAYKISNFKYGECIDNIFERLGFLEVEFGYRPYLTPDEPLLDSYIREAKLYEIHMHLNGTSSFEQNWYHALLKPELFINELEKSWKKSKKVKLLYATHPYLRNLSDYNQLLMTARVLRELFLTWINGLSTEIECNLKKHLFNVLNGEILDSSISFDAEFAHFSHINNDKNITISKLLNQPTHDNFIRELHWHIGIQKKLSKEPNEFYDIGYLLYIVCMNTLQRLFVQRSDQYGFDNFQKFAEDNARELAEQQYIDRFFQLHGPYRNQASDMAVIEGRFSPKATVDKNIEIIKKILLGFIEYHQQIKNTSENRNDQFELYSQDLSQLIELAIQQPNKLYLIAHFIKVSEEKYDSFHYETLRKGLWEKADVLVKLIHNLPNVKRIIQGIDAASNELETPPEVLAPIYRFCRFNGIKHFTYHVGEDFEHLISGIRAIYEAIEFLPLQNGDRLGHATAIGITPKFWLNNSPNILYLKMGEWLDNLIFIRQMVLSYNLENFNILEIENKIQSLFHQLYEGISYKDSKDFSGSNIYLIHLAYSYRYLDPQKVSAFLEGAYTPFWEGEFEHLQSLDKKALQLAKITWFDDKVRQRRKKIVAIDINFSAKQMLSLQQCVQKIVSERKIIIESLLTSNVRISHYSSLNEHHIFRWLHLKNCKIDGDSKMRIILGSDDPGIFATDLRGEFYHLFCALKCKFKYSDEKALSIIKKLNENGRVYHFH